jgi:hypothetical protein
VNAASDRAAELDLMPEYEAIICIEHEFPGWMIFRAGQGRWLNSCFARRHSDGHQVEGEDWADLRDQIIKTRWEDTYIQETAVDPHLAI